MYQSYGADSEEAAAGLVREAVNRTGTVAATLSVAPITAHHQCPSGDDHDHHGDDCDIDDEDVNEEDSDGIGSESIKVNCNQLDVPGHK